jgi:uncharacterized DUF497 family protein
MKYEWDEQKNQINIRKHGIDFCDVVELFNGPMLIQLDTRYDYPEDRWIGIGLLFTIVVIVIYVELEDKDTIRIISARKATKYEAQEYIKRTPR